ncbi:MAG: hypothetical protein FJ395_19170 [Verrucomicrobia bacterium]|nr:hypothetical protein [Verrucomicrobiota bacterium]
MKTLIVILVLAGYWTASGVVAQGVLPVQVTVEKKEATSRVVKQKAAVARKGNMDMHTPEVAERTQKMTLVLKLLNMSPAPLSGAVVNYTVVGRGRTVSDLKIAKEAKCQTDLPPMRPTSIELEPVSFLLEETVFRHGAFSNKNTQDGDQYYGVHVLVELGDRKFEFADPKDLVTAMKRLKPASDQPASSVSAATTSQARNFYLDEKPFDKLSNKKISDWGILALETSTKWKHGETEHFVVHFFANADAIARRCEKFYADTREFFGFRHDLMGALKSHVFAFHDPADWKSFKRQVKLADTTGGVARSHEFFYLSVTSDRQFDSLAHVQAHEMTHLVFNRFFNGRVPLWLNEGVAEYFGLKRIVDLTTFRSYVGRAKPFPLDKLFDAEKYPEQEQALRSFYAESAIVVDFLTHTAERRALLPKFIDAMIAKDDADAALKLYGFNTRADFNKAYERHRASFPKN